MSRLRIYVSTRVRDGSLVIHVTIEEFWARFALEHFHSSAKRGRSDYTDESGYFHLRTFALDVSLEFLKIVIKVSLFFFDRKSVPLFLFLSSHGTVSVFQTLEFSPYSGS